MNALEEIHIRITEGTREELIENLKTDLQTRDPISGLETLSIYYHARYETDLCLHLHWDKPLPAQGSAVAMQILAGIQDLGSVKHTVWTETFTQ